MNLCPHCRQPIHRAPPELVALADSLDLPRREKQVLDGLIGAFPRFVTKDFLIESIYDRDEPDWAGDWIEAHVSKLRRKVEPHGWTVEGRRFAGYRIVETRTLLADGGAHAEVGFPLGRDMKARVGRLRGYGNAINAEAAAVFIEAAAEVIGGAT